ncbi:MAG: hypothetical protein AW09_001141 [Candidatus Accumulibacter phosphatis]|uniref:Uncharacterized protein n=1 Tax=Candidatus Accumulibacter phosphatis TaxID=327160 RepID=A0A080LXU5_9PROT|nr:MAG: hypothetical protein AW09_001141 [Candidatus Accumulibacter phosphatis]
MCHAPPWAASAEPGDLRSEYQMAACRSLLLLRGVYVHPSTAVNREKTRTAKALSYN